ncbi:MAG: UDP-N-acetylglucosamine 1-carboxyvinyltransferase [Candidatus Levyibacteriota bacterium]
MKIDLEKMIIKGKNKLTGTISVSGSKNVALKAIVAACLTSEEVTIENIPLITDFRIMAEIVEELGGKVKINDHSITLRIKEIKTNKITLSKAAEIRTSFMFLAPLLARKGKAIIPNPGGCRIGARPIDRIIKGLLRMGTVVDYDSEDGYFHASLSSPKFKGTRYVFSKNTHTGTETMLLAAVLAEGTTVLRNAAEEPEVDELIAFLNKMGAQIKRTDRRVITIHGVKKLHGTTFKIGFDRNEIVTFAIAAVLTEGDIFIKGISRVGLEEFLSKLDEAGGGCEEKENGIRFFYKGKLKAVKVITSFYPGFMTDWQGPWTVLMTKANGTSVIHEAVYENRFTYAEELNKMGAKLKLFNPKLEDPEDFYNFNIHDDNGYFHAAKIYGPVKLHNAVLNVSDLRAGATLVLAALAARGESIIFGLEHLDRGYEDFVLRLRDLGASIRRITE